MDDDPKSLLSNVVENANEILVSTDDGIVCLSFPDYVATNLHLSPEELQTVAQQFLVQEDFSKRLMKDFKYSFSQHQFSSDATVDSDEPTSDCSAFTNLTTTTNCLDMQLEFTEPVVVDNSSKVSSNISDSDTGSITNLNANNAQIFDGNKLPQKKRGGWPKGRKRKPELLHLPPKAPATGYNLYLNETRKEFKDTKLAFHEITKIVGNRWSSLSLEQKQPYLERAEEDKRRYREELRAYRQSGSYQLYLAKKRRKRVQNNVLSESDMDATDDIDDEDNEELYCRTCDQWFHNLHNKREHLQGRQHFQAVAGDMRSELEPDKGGDKLNAEPNSSNSNGKELLSVSESIANLISVVTKREKEIKTLKMHTQESKAAHDALYEQLRSLTEREMILKEELKILQNAEKSIETKVFQLWKVPSLFITTELSSNYIEMSEYLTDE